MDDVHSPIPFGSILSRLSRVVEGTPDINRLLFSLHSSFPDQEDMKNVIFKLEAYAYDVLRSLSVCPILVMK